MNIDEITKEEMDAGTENFFALVQESLEPMGKWFVTECFEGHQMQNPPDGLFIEDWSGWLVPIERSGITQNELDGTEQSGLIVWRQNGEDAIAVEWRDVGLYKWDGPIDPNLKPIHLFTIELFQDK